MKKFDWIKQGEDYEVYEVDGKYIMVVWGYSKRGELGALNVYGTDCLVATWEGEPCAPDDLPKLADPRWMPLQGFNVDEDKGGGYDWDDYAAKVDEILAGMEQPKKIILARLPEETHKALKVKLAQEGKSIQEFIEEKVKEYLKK